MTVINEMVDQLEITQFKRFRPLLEAAILRDANYKGEFLQITLDPWMPKDDNHRYSERGIDVVLNSDKLGPFNLFLVNELYEKYGPETSVAMVTAASFADLLVKRNREC